VHISELAERHVEIPEQVVQVGNEIMVKVIDIDLERRRISLSLKQANEAAHVVDPHEFDPTQYGMEAHYDEQGNYIYPEGFDPETGNWLPGYEEQQAEWERQYEEARARFEQHLAQIRAAQEAEVEEAGPSSYTSEAEEPSSALDEESLRRLREQFGGAER
jgi:small subunit ribosomal protein S1